MSATRFFNPWTRMVTRNFRSMSGGLGATKCAGKRDREEDRRMM